MSNITIVYVLHFNNIGGWYSGYFSSVPVAIITEYCAASLGREERRGEERGERGMERGGEGREGRRGEREEKGKKKKGRRGGERKVRK